MSDSQLYEVTHIDNVKLSDDGNSVIIIDQTLLPSKLRYLTLSDVESIYEAIYKLRVRGAPAIGICAAYGIYILSKQINADTYEEFYHQFVTYKNRLNSSRPTAVNLNWALSRMEQVVVNNSNSQTDDIITALAKECKLIHSEDIAMCYEISKNGLTLIKPEDGILTHCNAGPLATSRYGTALGPLFLGKELGMNFRVYADETRPLLQGARLTSYELERAGINVTLICDNMASIVMKQGLIQACFVGCDRIAANGDTANKIGTSGVAVIAAYYGIPFYVLGPTSTIDFNCLTGDDIEIELRNPDEIKSMFYTQPVALPETKCYNPAFDVTDHTLITAIVTEKGVIYPPFDINLRL